MSVDEYLNDADSNSIEGDCHDHTYVGNALRCLVMYTHAVSKEIPWLLEFFTKILIADINKAKALNMLDI